jgi:type IV pilus biogenesis protein PilP
MSSRKHYFPFVFLALSTICTAQTPATASSQPLVHAPPLSSAAAAEIQSISENKTVLEARLSELELQAKIAAKKKELSNLNGGSTFSALGSSLGDPSVIYVQGLKGHVEALLAFPGGVVQRVKAGDTVGDRKVARISTNEVALTDLNGKNERRLAFGTSAVARDTGTSGPLGQPSTSYGPPTAPGIPTR